MCLSLHRRDDVHVCAQIGIGDQAARADRRALSAGDALFIVDHCKVLNNVDRVEFAQALAEMAADAADPADLPRARAALAVRAGDDDVG